ncbi:MAG: hypothetical protein KF901_05365 [Myxococcales bacterium]|nr:hypothetical protein [Myxococcales bacterium]
MATFLFGLGGLAVLALLAMDIVILRGLERADEEAPTELAPERSSTHRAGAIAALGLGVLGFPGTLAPVVLTVLAFQAHPITTDGWVALIAVIVAGLSMSAAVKSFRIAQLLGRVSGAATRLVGATVVYLLVWAVLIGLLLLLGRAPEGPVRLVIWVYSVLLLAGTAVVAATGRDTLRKLRAGSAAHPSP